MKKQDKFIITGGTPLKGSVTISGAKNAALKAIVAACLTQEDVIIENFPRISDLDVMVEIIRSVKGEINVQDHRVTVNMTNMSCEKIPLEIAAKIRTSFMFISPLLARLKKAIIPNPGGDKIGLRPIDRLIKGLQKMGAEIAYDTNSGYFYAETKGLQGTRYTIEKNTHTGTESLIMAAVLAKGTTILTNCAEEPEVDELIQLLTDMGGNVKRSKERKITIVGVEKLHGATIRILPDRNEIITFAIAAVITKGEILVKDAGEVDIAAFLEKFTYAGGGYEKIGSSLRFFYKGPLIATNATTQVYPGFMTDWQAPWAVLMTQAAGVSIVHETVFENRFGYVKELQKMGANIEPVYDMVIEDPEKTYNFNLSDKKPNYFQAIRITGPMQLFGETLKICDLRAGATLVLAALCAKGKSTITGLDQIDRGYESIEMRLAGLGADIKRI